MATNDFLPFCPTDTGTNLLTQGEYAAAAQRVDGNQPGVASSKLNNKAIRQSAVMTSQLAQYLSDHKGVDMIDDGVSSVILSILKSALIPKAPLFRQFLSGSGTFTLSYVFAINAGSATSGATYTHNGFTYTVVSTVATSATVIMHGTGTPLPDGTLTKSSGTGDATLTFNAVAQPLYLRVLMVGAGGGAAGTGTSGSTNGSNGGNSTFGTSFLTAAGGQGSSGPNSGAGGTATINSPAIGLAQTGTVSQAGASAFNVSGGNGGSSPFFAGGGAAGAAATAGVAGSPNSGGGGGGAGAGVSSGAGSSAGGGSGGFIDAIIEGVANIASSYAYSVGVSGARGTAGTAGFNGGAGADGQILVYEYFQ